MLTIMRSFGSSYEIVDKPEVDDLFEIFTARDVDNEELVTIRLLTEKATQSDLKARFINEMQIWSKLNHRNIVPLLEVGEYEGRPYCVEGIAGSNRLSELMNASLPLQKGLDMVAQCFDGLAHAHDSGVIHRDLKADVIYSTREGRALVGGFGMARSEEDESGLTKTGMIVGTPTHMAPERILSDDYDSAVDIYAMGIILFELITGKPPFIGTTSEILRSHLEVTPSLPEGLQGSLTALLTELLSKTPQARPTAKSAAIRIRKIMSSSNLEAHPLQDSPSSTAALEPVKKRKPPYAALFSLALLCMTFIYLFIVGQGEKSIKPRPMTRSATAKEVGNREKEDEAIEGLLAKRRAIVKRIDGLHLFKEQELNTPQGVQAACGTYLRQIDELATLPSLPSSHRYTEGATVTLACAHFLVSLGIRGLMDEGMTIEVRNYPYRYYEDLTILSERSIKARVPSALERTLRRVVERTSLCSSRHIHLRSLNAIALAFTFQRPKEKEAIHRLEKLEERFGEDATEASDKGKEWLLFLLYHNAYYRHVYSLLDDSVEISEALKATINRAKVLAPPLAKESPLSLRDQYCIHTRMVWLHRNRLHDEIADVSLELRSPGKTPALLEAIRYGGELMDTYNERPYADAVHRLVLTEIEKRDKEAAGALRKKWAHFLKEKR